MAAEPENPAPKFILAVCNNDPDIKRAPDEFVTGVFDEFAEIFDECLTGLGYRVPQIISSKVEEFLYEPTAKLRVLDAGCGTGLLAASLRPWASHLTGVDLSPGMLVSARAQTG